MPDLILENLIFLRLDKACFKNFCYRDLGTQVESWPGSQAIGAGCQVGSRAAGQPRSPVRWAGSPSPTVVPAGLQGLCLPGFHKRCRNTSLFPRKTAFLWNQNPHVGNCFRNCSARSPGKARVISGRQILGCFQKDGSNRAQG